MYYTCIGAVYTYVYCIHCDRYTLWIYITFDTMIRMAVNDIMSAYNTIYFEVT